MDSNSSILPLYTKTCKNRNICWGATILSVLFFILVLVIVSICALTARPETGIPFSDNYKDAHTLCEICGDHIFDDKDHEGITRYKTDSGIDICCMLRNGSVVPHTRPIINQGASDELLVGAHLYLDDGPPFEGNVLPWSDKSGYGTAYQTNIDMIKGGYVIPISGVYDVKSCVEFKVVNDTRSVSHYIVRNNTVLPERSEEILLVRKDYVTGRHKMTCLGAYLRLVRGDKVYVKVSEFNAIYKQWWSNWFDIMKMPGTA